MKFSELKSIGHNIADSLASGMGFPIGLYTTDIFAEASNSPEGHITVNFLAGTTEGGRPSKSMTEAVALYRDALTTLCERHGVDVSTFKTLTARFAVDAVHGGHFAVTVEDHAGRRSTDRYVGVPGRRVHRHHDRP